MQSVFKIALDFHIYEGKESLVSNFQSRKKMAPLPTIYIIYTFDASGAIFNFFKKAYISFDRELKSWVLPFQK